MQVLTDDLLLISVFVEDAVVEIVDIVDLVHDVLFELFIRDTICCSDCEGVGHEPVVYDSLRDCDEFISGVRANIQPDGMHESSCTRADHLLLKCT